MGHYQASFNGLPVAVIKIFLGSSITFLCIKFPVKHILDAFDDAGDFFGRQTFPDLFQVYMVSSLNMPQQE